MRDFSTISRSARWLLLAKAQSGLPYARDVAELVLGPEAIAPPSSPLEAVRRRHFELRARSLDEALDIAGATRVLELAAGFSFRGLARAAHDAVDYLDTDLPDIVELKRDVLARLAPPVLAGTYRIEPLDAMNDAAFAAAVASLPDGALTVTHEGLLMYLTADEKARLAASIRTALRARGGRWITGDIYLRRDIAVPRAPEVEKFLADHRVEEQKFESWDAAEAFFAAAGFAIEHRLVPASDTALTRQTWILAAR